MVSSKDILDEINALESAEAFKKQREEQLLLLIYLEQ